MMTNFGENVSLLIRRGTLLGLFRGIVIVIMIRLNAISIFVVAVLIILKVLRSHTSC